MNWIRFLEGKLTAGDRVIVFTHAAPAGMQTFETGSPFINIRRYGPPTGGNAIARYKRYLGFYISVIRQLARFKPGTVLYYETLSAIPGMYYKYFLRRNSRLLVHYHEYTSPQEYQDSMLINYRAQRMEKRLYPRYSGISHTNPTRRDLFSRDNSGISLPAQLIWPNYPPEEWKKEERKQTTGSPVRFIYVGSLDLNTMYVNAFARWIIAQEGRASWEIYSWNCTPDTKRYLTALNTDSIVFHEGVSYSTLPGILPRFDVGVILYKGHIPNYIHNAPNKLFEYWSCGLDVWFPVQMTGAFPYINAQVYPRILAVDFDALERWPLSETDRSGLVYRPSPYTSESEAEKFFNRLIR